MSMRFIIHVDMDAFFASVEQHDAPTLRGRPVVVGGASQRGVVAAASYEARLFGVRSAMPGWRAKRLCPQAVFVPPRFERYREVSKQVFKVFARHTDIIEGLSLDEAYLDLTSRVRDAEALKDTGRRLKQAIAAETGLTASVGMAHNKLVAKLASDYDKPDGLVYVAPESVHRFMDPLPIRRMPGVGPRTAERLQTAGILTIGQLRHSSPALLDAVLGNSSAHLRERAAGQDDRPVKRESVRKSISQENTFDKDISNINYLKDLIKQQSNKISDRLRARQLLAGTVTIKLRSASFSTITRSRALATPTAEPTAIAAVAEQLLDSWLGWHQGQTLRLLGVGASSLVSAHTADQAEA
jgi:DNA polymerase-4